MAMTVELAAEILGEAGVLVSEAELELDRSLVCCPVAEWTHPSGEDSNPSCLIFNHADSDEDREDPCEFSYYCFSCKSLGPLWRIPAIHYNQTLSKKWKRLLRLATKANERNFSEQLKRKHRRAAKEGIDRLESSTETPSYEQVQKIFETVHGNPDAARYLVGRKVPASVSSMYGLMYDPVYRRVVFPVKDADKQFQTAVGRSIDPGDKRYYNYFECPTERAVGGIHLFQRGLHKSAVLVEGYFDLLRQAVACMRNEALPVCIFKSSVSDLQFSELARLDIPLRPAFDGDAAGREGIKKLCRKAAKQGVTCRPIWLPEGEDPGNLTESRFEELLNRETRSRVRRTKKTPPRGGQKTSTETRGKLSERIRSKQLSGGSR